MKQSPLVSIIINNYNYGNFLPEAIESALGQTYSPVEVIVVDDGSTDDSRKVIASYSDRVISVFKENGGQGSAFNQGFAQSQGDLVCFLDADDIFLKHKVAKVVEVFASDDEIGWCFHSLTLIARTTGEVQGKTRLFPLDSQARKTKKYDFRLQLRQGKLQGFYPSPTSGLCFRRSVLEQILPMPTQFFITSADHYLRYAALAVQGGFALDEELSLQMLHGKNATTAIQYRPSLKIRTRKIPVAYYLRIYFPEIGRATNYLFARGLIPYWFNPRRQPEYEFLIRDYFSRISISEKITIYLLAIYYAMPFRRRYHHRIFATKEP